MTQLFYPLIENVEFQVLESHTHGRLISFQWAGRFPVLLTFGLPIAHEVFNWVKKDKVCLTKLFKLKIITNVLLLRQQASALGPHALL